ncbi:MAG: ABC transporter permease [Mogibacterium sp.]|nr:ABC transporter permease [Mogibacterium sp.]
MFSRIGYAIKQAFSQIGRNKGMYFTSTLAIMAMMLILGLFFVAFVNLENFTNSIEEDYNVIQVYMNNDNTPEKTEAAGKQIKAIDGVQEVTYTTKAEALETLKKRWGNNAYLLESLKENPLPDSYSVHVKDSQYADKVAKAVVEIDGVNDITYYQETIKKLAKISRFVEIGSIVVMVFLIIISVVIVANTIKLTVMNREREITIMKYLGATDAFVRAPFIIGGVIIGIVASAIATGLVYFIYAKLMDVIGADITRILSVSLIAPQDIVGIIFAMFIILGVGIGVIGSSISVRKFLVK